MMFQFLGCIEGEDIPPEASWMITSSFKKAAQAALAASFLGVAADSGSLRAATFHQLSSNTKLSNAFEGCMSHCPDAPERACGLASGRVNSFAVYQNVAHNQTISVVVQADNTTVEAVKRGTLIFIFSGIVIKLLVEVLRWQVWSDCIRSCWPHLRCKACTTSETTNDNNQPADVESGASAHDD